MSSEHKMNGGKEDDFTAAIEARTSKVPSSAYLGAALTSIALSAILKMNGKDQAALFVGQWAAPFLLLGIYNKLVKQLGSDSESRERPLSSRTATA
jgi:hypothetical protein